MKYSKGYKYQVEETKVFVTDFILIKERIETPFITLEMSGILIIKKGYAWDGPSGFTYDDDLFILASLVHDALYQLMRGGFLPFSDWRKADYELKRVIDNSLESIFEMNFRFKEKFLKMIWSVRIIYIMGFLKLAKGKHARPSEKRKIYEIIY